MIPQSQTRPEGETADFHTSWGSYYRVSDYSSSSRSIWRLGKMTLSEIVRLGAQLMLQYVLKREVSGALGIRLSGFVTSVEIIFGIPGLRLALRHDSQSGAAPYVSGTLLALRKVGSFVGLVRGFDRLLEL